MNQVILLTIIVSFLIVAVLSPVFISLFKKLNLGQTIRAEGPVSHQKKSGTPTMGGLVIIFSVVVTTLLVTIWQSETSIYTYLLLIAIIGFGLLGFLDDFIIVGMKRNLGLTSIQKLVGQIIISLLFYVFYKQFGFSTAVTIPYFDYSIELGFFYVFFVIFWLVGFSNAVNITDGLDGLVSGVVIISFGAFGWLAWQVGIPDLAIFSVAVVGAALGFLLFNAYPAKIFMGDTGSLALGGAIAAIAILLNLEILLILIGGVFVVETLSVILQVASFKMTGKRIFKMSPLHHHYELSGWSERRVVITFWVAGLVFTILGIYIEVCV